MIYGVGAYIPGSFRFVSFGLFLSFRCTVIDKAIMSSYLFVPYIGTTGFKQNRFLSCLLGIPSMAIRRELLDIFHSKNSTPGFENRRCHCRIPFIHITLIIFSPTYFLSPRVGLPQQAYFQWRVMLIFKLACLAEWFVERARGLTRPVW